MNTSLEKTDTASLRRRFSLLGSALGPFLALGVVFLFFALAEEWQSGRRNFVTADNARLISVNTAAVAIGALGMTVVIISGGIDLSAGTALAMCATVLAWALKDNYSAWLAVPLALGAGCVAGCLNGLLISALRVVPFIVTLGTMTFYLGFGKMVAHETTVRPEISRQVPAWLQQFLSVRSEALWPSYHSATPWIEWTLNWVRFPLGVWLGLLLAAILAAVLKYTVFGRHVFALGSNEATARLCGINVPLVKIAVYTLSGLFIGIAGIYQFSRLSSGNPTSGIGLELRIIAAVVIGGGSLNGGRGSVLGSLAGAAIMYVIASGCTQLGLTNPVQDMILGVIIVAAVTLDQLRQRRLAD